MGQEGTDTSIDACTCTHAPMQALVPAVLLCLLAFTNEQNSHPPRNPSPTPPTNTLPNPHNPNNNPPQKNSPTPTHSQGARRQEFRAFYAERLAAFMQQRSALVALQKGWVRRRGGGGG